MSYLRRIVEALERIATATEARAQREAADMEEIRKLDNLTRTMALVNSEWCKFRDMMQARDQHIADWQQSVNKALQTQYGVTVEEERVQ